MPAGEVDACECLSIDTYLVDGSARCVELPPFLLRLHPPPSRPPPPVGHCLPPTSINILSLTGPCTSTLVTRILRHCELLRRSVSHEPILQGWMTGRKRRADTVFALSSRDGCPPPQPQRLRWYALCRTTKRPRPQSEMKKEGEASAGQRWSYSSRCGSSVGRPASSVAASE